MKNKKNNYIEIFQSLCIFSIVLSFLFIKDRVRFTLIGTMLSLILMVINFIMYHRETNRDTVLVVKVILSIATFLLFFISTIRMYK